MDTSEIHELVVRNMVCSRCLKVLRLTLETLDIIVLDIQLGKVKIRIPTTKITLEQIEATLEKEEFELVKNKEQATAEEIKLLLIELVSNPPVDRTQKMSDLIAKKLQKDYSTLSRAFSKVEGINIERYFILLRIEKIKELIFYDEMNFSEIAYELGYNNISHLSRQFKQMTGMSMSEYKEQKNDLRIPLDKIV